MHHDSRVCPRRNRGSRPVRARVSMILTTTSHSQYVVAVRASWLGGSYLYLYYGAGDRVRAIANKDSPEAVIVLLY